jgi:large subunit ribosomal protein L17
MPWFRKLGMRSEHRLAVLKNQVTDLIKHEAITTTLQKAKELRRIADWMVTMGKKGYIEPNTKADGAAIRNRRMAKPWIMDTQSFKDLFQELPIRFAQRKGGYTRILRLGQRQGDGAELARIEWVEWDSKADREKFQKLHKEREANLSKVRQQSEEVRRKHWHSASSEAIKEVGKAMHNAQSRKDIVSLERLYSRVQSRHDIARATNTAFPTHIVPIKLPSLELPAEFKVVKVPRNRFNKYGGRGLALAKDAKDDASK